MNNFIVGGYVIDITRMTKNISSDFFTGIEKKERLPLYYFNTDSKKKEQIFIVLPLDINYLQKIYLFVITRLI